MPDYPDILSMLEREYDLDEKFRQSCPICDCCGEHILPGLQDHMYDLPCGLYCEDCVETFRVLTENYVG